MQGNKIQHFDLHTILSPGQSLVAGNIAVKVDDRGRIEASQFRYSEAFLDSPDAYPLSPMGPPLNRDIHTYVSSGRDFPGFIDDILPDDWGRKIIATRLRARFVDTMTVLRHIGEGLSTGSYRITPKGDIPNWVFGIPYERAERLAKCIYSGELHQLGGHADDVALLLRGGSGTGGARPKLLVTHQATPQLLKLNKRSDAFNMAGVEWASLEVMRLSGLEVAQAKVVNFAGNIDGILVERFDINQSGAQLPMATINGLLKNPLDQEDPLYGTYEDIANCIRRYSYRPEDDLLQLLGQLLINQALANTDDHLRNFSMMKDDSGWRMTPAYDVLPQQTFSTEHAIGFNGSNYLPKFKDALTTAKGLGISPKKATAMIDALRAGLSEWGNLLEKANIDDEAFKNLVVNTQK